jgi:hypothetical protein
VRLAEILSDSRTSAIVGVAIAWSFRADDDRTPSGVTRRASANVQHECRAPGHCR